VNIAVSLLFSWKFGDANAKSENFELDANIDHRFVSTGTKKILETHRPGFFQAIEKISCHLCDVARSATTYCIKGNCKPLLCVLPYGSAAVVSALWIHMALV